MPDISSNTIVVSAQNFRDMGGYPTADGRRTRRGIVFRSGLMAHIEEEDRSRLLALNIATICDFRTNGERLRAPTRWHIDSATELVERDHEMSLGELQLMIRRRDVSSVEIFEHMVSVYRALPFEQADSYRLMFSRLADGRVPLLFNCTAGKDRTGVAAALLLDLLGVKRETIMADYLHTNIWLPQLAARLERQPDYGDFVRDQHEAALPLLRAEAAYLEAMFDRVTEQCGSTHNFVTDHLHLTDTQVDVVRDTLLEPVS